MNNLRVEKASESALPFAPRKNLACRKILNNGEKYFFRILTEALPDCYVFPQVSFNALITHAHWITTTRGNGSFVLPLTGNTWILYFAGNLILRSLPLSSMTAAGISTTTTNVGMKCLQALGIKWSALTLEPQLT